jgi:hypothetical protein
MTNPLMHEIVFGTTKRGRKFWNDIEIRDREHLTKKVEESRIFNIPGRAVPKKPTETWSEVYFTIPDQEKAKSKIGAFFTIPSGDE